MINFGWIVRVRVKWVIWFRGFIWVIIVRWVRLVSLIMHVRWFRRIRLVRCVRWFIWVRQFKWVRWVKKVGKVRWVSWVRWVGQVRFLRRVRYVRFFKHTLGVKRARWIRRVIESNGSEKSAGSEGSDVSVESDGSGFGWCWRFELDQVWISQDIVWEKLDDGWRWWSVFFIKFKDRSKLNSIFIHSKPWITSQKPHHTSHIIISCHIP